jgi:Na+-driven multidrug efflux pump
VGKTLITVTLALGVAIAALMLLATYLVLQPYVYPIYPAFQNCPGAARITTIMLTIAALFLPTRAFNTTNIVGVLRGGGDVRFATLIDLLPLWVIAIPLAALVGLVAKLDILWVYLAMETENITKFFLGVFRFRSGAWIHDVTRTST